MDGGRVRQQDSRGSRRGGEDGNNYRWNQFNFSRAWIDRWARKSKMAMDTRLIFAPFRYFSRGNPRGDRGGRKGNVSCRTNGGESRLDESIIERQRSYRRNRESSSEVKNYGAIIRVRFEPRSLTRTPLVCDAFSRRRRTCEKRTTMMMGDNGGKGESAIEERRRRLKVTKTHIYISIVEIGRESTLNLHFRDS